MGDSLEVVVVVELWGGQEGQVVATVGDGCADEGQAVPQAGGAQVGSQEHWAGHGRQHVGELGRSGEETWIWTGFECELIYDTTIPKMSFHTDCYINSTSLYHIFLPQNGSRDMFKRLKR